MSARTLILHINNGNQSGLTSAKNTNSLTTSTEVITTQYAARVVWHAPTDENIEI